MFTQAAPGLGARVQSLHAALATTTVDVRGRTYLGVDRADAKLRYRSDPVGTRVEQTREGFTLHLDHAVHGIALGQVAALYDRDAIVAAGVIVGTSR